MNPNIILIFLCLLAGLLLKKSGKLPANAHQVMNAFVIWISLPALVLRQIPQLLNTTVISPELLIPVSMAWILFLLSFLFFSFIGRRLNWPNTTIGALILTAGLGNTAFVGFPLLEFLLGKEAVSIGILVDQPGTFLVLSTLGILTASFLKPGKDKRISGQQMLKNILLFPPFIALLSASLWWLSGTYTEGAVTNVLERLAGTLVPLALVAVGFQLNVSRAILNQHWKPLSLGLGFKLILAPAFFVLLYTVLLQAQGFATRVTLLEAAMAPMITAAVVAEEFELNAPLASLMVGIGIPLSIGTVYIWQQLL